jgi:DNA-directed RNA polymerase specialized sigma24 family protein
MSDEARQMNQLLTQAKQGNRAALDDLCRALAERLRVALQLRLWGWSRQNQEDILQNTLLVFAEKYDHIEDNPHIFALQVMHNKIGDAMRRMKSSDLVTITLTDSVEADPDPASAIVQMSDTDPESSYGEHIDGTALLERIHNELVQLPRFCRLFVVAMLEGKQVSEVWEFAHTAEPSMSRSAFDKRIFMCRKRLREAIGLDQ